MLTRLASCGVAARRGVAGGVAGYGGVAGGVARCGGVAGVAGCGGGTRTLDLYYDVLSPYSWFAFEVLMRYRQEWVVDVRLKPVLLAGITKATGNTFPGAVPAKLRYLMKDLVRCAGYFGVPLRIPKDPVDLILVKGSMVPNRFLAATHLLYPHLLEHTSRALWMAAWHRDEDFTSGEVLCRAGQEAGMTPGMLAKVRANMGHQEVKDALRANGTEALNHGAFGVPSIVHTQGGSPRVYFGSDRFPVLARDLGVAWRGPHPQPSTGSCNN